MPKTIPLISVIIPAFNEEKFLAACLDSLVKQNLESKDYEIIVIDNASSDNTSSIAKKFPVRVVYEQQRSVVAARQKGLTESKGMIIVSGDADTVYPPDWLIKIKNDFKKHPEIVALVGWIYFTGTTAIFNYSVSVFQQFNLLLSKLTGNFPLVFACNFAFYREAIYKIGGYPIHLPELGDQQYLLNRFRKLGLVLVDRSVYCYTSGRRHSSGLKNIFVYNGWYRLVGYTINKLLGFTLIGPAPAVRTSTPHAQKPRF